jgi:hypothetical protein
MTRVEDDFARVDAVVVQEDGKILAAGSTRDRGH